MTNDSHCSRRSAPRKFTCWVIWSVAGFRLRFNALEVSWEWLKLLQQFKGKGWLKHCWALVQTLTQTFSAPFRRLFLQEQIKTLDDSQIQNSSAMSYWSSHWWIHVSVELKIRWASSSTNKPPPNLHPHEPMMTVVVPPRFRIFVFVDWNIVEASPLRNIMYSN